VLRQNIRVQHAIEVHDRAIIMAAARVVSSGATLLGTEPDPFYGPDIDVADLRTLVQTGALPLTDGTDPVSLITVESRIEMSSGSSPALSGPPPAMAVLDGTMIGAGSCSVQPSATGTPARVRLAFAQPAAFSVSSPRPEEITAVLTSAATGSAAAAPVTYQVQPGMALRISVSAPGASLVVSAPGSTVFKGTAGC
jgi:hypothetical protein